MDAYLVILVVAALAIAIAYYAIKEDKQDKEIQRLIDKAIDRDGDGIVFERTALETKRPVKKKAATKPKTKAKAPVKKKAPAKKKPVAKKKA